MTENDLILYKTSIMDEEVRFMYVRKLVQTSLTFFENYIYHLLTGFKFITKKMFEDLPQIQKLVQMTF